MNILWNTPYTTKHTPYEIPVYVDFAGGQAHAEALVRLRLTIIKAQVNPLQSILLDTLATLSFYCSTPTWTAVRYTTRCTQEIQN